MRIYDEMREEKSMKLKEVEEEGRIRVYSCMQGSAIFSYLILASLFSFVTISMI